MEEVQFSSLEYEQMKKENQLLKQQIRQVKAMLQAKETANEFLRNELKQAVQDLRLIKQSNNLSECQCSCLHSPNQIKQVFSSLEEPKKKKQEQKKYNKSIRDYAQKIELKGRVYNTNIQQKQQVQIKNRAKSKIRQHQVQKQETKSASSKKPTFIMTQVRSKPTIFQFEWDKDSFDPAKLEIIQGLKVRRIVKDQKNLVQMDGVQKMFYQLGYGGGCISSKSSLPQTGRHKVTFQIILQSDRQAISMGILTQQKKKYEFNKLQKQLIQYFSLRNTMGSFNIQDKQVISCKQNNLGTVQGGCIEMVVDLDQWVIQFNRLAIPKLNLQTKQTKRKISQSFRGKNIYVFLHLRNPGDIVNIIKGNFCS